MLKLITIVMLAAITTTACNPSRADETTRADDEAGFITYVRTGAPATSGVVAMTDDQLLHVGNGTCVALRNNPNTTPALIARSYDESWPGAGATLVGAAVTYLCKEFISRVDD